MYNDYSQRPLKISSLNNRNDATVAQHGWIKPLNAISIEVILNPFEPYRRDSTEKGFRENPKSF